MQFSYLWCHWAEWPRLLRVDRLHRRRTAGGGASVSVSSARSFRRQPALRSAHAADSGSSQRSLAFTQHCCSCDLSPGRCFISGLHLWYKTRGSACHQHLSFPSQTRIHSRHPNSSTLKAQISSRGPHDNTHRSGASSSPSRVPHGVRRERVFFWSLSEDHQGAPSAGWGVWSHGEPWLRGTHRYNGNIREAGRSDAN